MRQVRVVLIAAAVMFAGDSGIGWAADPVTERLVKVLEDQQQIIKQQHDALMELLRERHAALPARVSVPAVVAPAQATPVQIASRAPVAMSPGGAVETPRLWYAGVQARGTLPHHDKATPDDECVATSFSFGVFVNSTSCDQTLISRQGVSGDSNFGYGGSIEAGYRIFDWLRVGGEAGFDWIGVDKISSGSRPSRDAKGSLLLGTGLATAYIDFKTGTLITPYIGAGAGGFYADMRNIRADRARAQLDDSAFGFAVAGMLGAEFSLSEEWSVVAGYRYLLLPDISGKTTRQKEGDASLDFHQFNLGARRYF